MPTSLIATSSLSLPASEIPSQMPPSMLNTITLANAYQPTNAMNMNKGSSDKEDEVLRKDERFLDEYRLARASSAAAKNQQQRLLKNANSTTTSDTTAGEDASSSTRSGHQAHTFSSHTHSPSNSNSNSNSSITNIAVINPSTNTQEIPMPGHYAHDYVPPPRSSVNNHHQEINVGSSKRKHSTSSSSSTSTSTSTSPSNANRNRVRNGVAHSKLSARSVAGRLLAMTSSSSADSSKLVPRPAVPVLPPFLKKQKHLPEMAVDSSQLEHAMLSRLIKDQNQRMGLSKNNINNNINIGDRQSYMQYMNILRMKHLQSPSTHLEEQIPLSSSASKNLLAYQKALVDNVNTPLFSTAQARAQAQAPYADLNLIRPPSPPSLPTPQTKVDPAAVAAAYFFLQQQQKQEEREHRERLQQVRQQQQQHRENIKRRRSINDALLSLASITSSSYPGGSSVDAGVGTMENILTSRSYAAASVAAARMQQQEELLARYNQASTGAGDVGVYSSQGQSQGQGQGRHPYDLVQSANIPNIQTLNQPRRNLGIGIGGSSIFTSRNPLLQQQHSMPDLAAAPSAMTAMTPSLLIPGPHNSSRQSPYDELNDINRQEHKNNLMTLKTESDVIWLSKFLCFLRAECCEVHKATPQDVKERRKSKQVKINQVGIRCRFCAHLPHNKRAGRSSCFPSSVDRIYQSVTMMIREHFSVCEEFPPEVRQKYAILKQHTKKGEMESKSHWKSAAEELGMVNLEHPMLGIFFRKDLTPEQLELLNS